MSNFPGQIDTDAELPAIYSNISEFGEEAINAIRSSIFAIEDALGTNIQGSQQDLKTRLNQILNPDGTFKSSALIAAGLIALPITNSMVGSSAGILETKLDLDFPTQTLQNEINSNDIDITALQVAIEDILNRIQEHFDGIAFRHDGYAIDLDSSFPSSTPPWFAPFSATTVSDAILALKIALDNHESATAVAAHNASNISILPSTFQSIDPDNVQEAIQQLDALASIQFDQHRDDMHANGIGRWANSSDGYNAYLQKLPININTSASAAVVSGVRKVIQFTGNTLSTFNIKQGDVVVISSPSSLVGSYVIDDVGPRASIGSRSALTSDEVEIVGTFPVDGYSAVARIFGPSSVSTIKGNLAPTIYQIDTRVDSIQISRPNSGRVTSLGINPIFLSSTSQFVVEVGIASGISRSLVINGLNLDRNQTIVSQITLDTVVERINYLFQNKNDGYAFPAAAYRVGDELMLSHNWDESIANYLKIPSSGASSNTLFLLGMDGYGANIIDQTVYPTKTTDFYVSGRQFKDVALLLDATANIVGQTFTFSSVNPLQNGVRIGHLLQLLNHPNATECGTYYITSVNSNSITINKVAGITTSSNVSVKVYSDAVALDELSNYNKDLLLEVFVDASAQIGYNIRLEKTQNINNVAVINVSDNFLATSLVLTAITSSGGYAFDLGIDALPQTIPSTFVGKIDVFSGSNIEKITLEIQSPITVGTDDLVVYDHIDEEEVLEICSVKFDGLLTLSDIKDKRMFGSTGIDEIREDVIQTYIETPLTDLRVNGVVYGLDIVEDNYQDISAFGSNIYGVLFRGGVAYAGGVRLDIPSSFLMLPQIAGTYFIYLDPLGTLSLANTAQTTLMEAIDGYIGNVALLAKVVNTAVGVAPLIATDFRYFINHLDDKLDIILDIGEHSVGNVSSVAAALNYISNYPTKEKSLIRIVSFSRDSVVIPPGFTDVSIKIDGQIGDLILDSDCRVFSDGLSSRSTPHIDGYVFSNTSATNLVFENLNVFGAITIHQSIDAQLKVKNCSIDSVTLTGVNSSHALFDSCISGQGFSSNGSEIRILNTIVLAGAVDVDNGPYALVESCIFNTPDGLGTLNADFNELVGNIYDGLTASATLTIGSDTTIDRCIFKEAAQSGASLIVASNVASYVVNINNCLFNNITLDDTSIIVDGTNAIVNISNCIFDTNTYSSAGTAIKATNVRNNDVINSTNACLVDIIGQGSFNDNRGFNAVNATTEVGTNDVSAIISGNVFSDTSLGFNITLNTVGAVVSNNFFNNVADSTSAIVMGSSSSEIQIIGNYIGGSAATGNGINLGSSAGDIIIADNFFRTNTAFLFSSAVKNVSIDNNVFHSISSNTSTLQLGNNCKLSNNLSFTQSFTLSGTAPQKTVISGNTLTTLTVAVALTNPLISNNTITTLALSSGSITSGLITGNIYGISAPGTFQVTTTDINNNVITSITTFNNIRWNTSSFVSNKIVAATAMTFNMNTGSTILISNNSFSGNAITLTAASTITDVVYTDNVGGSLSSSTVITQSVISKNDGNISLSGGLSTVQINQNNDGILTLSGTINNTVISGNQFTSVSIDSSATSIHNSFSNNIVDGDVVFFAAAGTLEWKQGSISSNIFSGDFTIGSGAGSYTLDKVIIENNYFNDLSIDIDILQNSLINNNIFNSSTISCTPTLINVQFCNNHLASTASFTSSGSISTIVMMGNRLMGNVSISCSASISNAHIDHNRFSGDLTFSCITSSINYINFNSVNNLDLSGLGTSIGGLVLLGNHIVTTLTLPSIGSFSASQQSKFTDNFAGTWSCVSAFTTSGTRNVFPWGNTSGNDSVNVNFNGTNATNTITANDVLAAITSGIQC